MFSNILEFFHLPDVDDLTKHMWHFFYLHGEIENANMEAFGNGGCAPDLQCASESISRYVHDDFIGEMFLPCIACGKPAVVGISAKEWEDGRRHVCGRISWISDKEGMRHVYSPEDWR